MRGKMFATSLAAIVATSLATSPATALAQPAAAPDLATARQWFEAGKDQQIVAIELKDDSPPALVYLVAQGHARLQQRAQARAAYDRLAARPQTDPWHFIGRSAVLLGDAQLIPGVTAAEQGVDRSDGEVLRVLPEAGTRGARTDECRVDHAHRPRPPVSSPQAGLAGVLQHPA
jgi:hypothetical protein